MDSDANVLPMIVWSGLDLRPGVAGGVEAARGSIREKIWTSAVGRGHRYELLALASRVRPTAFLSSLELREDHVFDGAPPEVTWHNDLMVTWSLLYRRIAETGPEIVVPYAVYVLGVNPPTELEDAEIEEFNEFYTNVHMPEVAERRGALRASRYELDRVVRPPTRGAPHFLAVYEVDKDAAQVRRHIGPPYQTGPKVWQKHTTPWRFWYRRLSD
jgi:hypothetical protein